MIMVLILNWVYKFYTNKFCVVLRQFIIAGLEELNSGGIVYYIALFKYVILIL